MDTNLYLDKDVLCNTKKLEERILNACSPQGNNKYFSGEAHSDFNFTHVLKHHTVPHKMYDFCVNQKYSERALTTAGWRNSYVLYQCYMPEEMQMV